MKNLEDCQKLCEYLLGSKESNGVGRFSEASFTLSFDGTLWRCEYLVQKKGFGKQAGGFRHLNPQPCIDHIYQRLRGVANS